MRDPGRAVAPISSADTSRSRWSTFGPALTPIEVVVVAEIAACEREDRDGSTGARGSHQFDRLVRVRGGPDRHHPAADEEHPASLSREPRCLPAQVRRAWLRQPPDDRAVCAQQKERDCGTKGKSGPGFVLVRVFLRGYLAWRSCRFRAARQRGFALEVVVASSCSRQRGGPNFAAAAECCRIALRPGRWRARDAVWWNRDRRSEKYGVLGERLTTNGQPASSSALRSWFSRLNPPPQVGPPADNGLTTPSADLKPLSSPP
jgi:hypothetical protein